MSTGLIVGSWKDGQRAFLSVRVAEADGSRVEYVGSAALRELAGLTVAQQKAALVAAVKAARDAQMAGPVDLTISGSVTL